MTPDIRSAAAGGDEGLQGTVAGLNAVVMLGSFMHAAPTAEKTAELSAGGLAALTRLPLTAVAWYADGPDGLLRVAGRCEGGPGISAGVATALRRIGTDLSVFRPTRRTAAELPRTLRRAGVEELFALPLRVSTDHLGFLLAGGEPGSLPGDLTLIHALGAQTSTALYVARLHESEALRLRELRDLAAELRAQGELLSRALRLQEELIDLVLRGKDAHTIVDHVGRQLGAPVWLLDSERNTIAHATGDGATAGALPRPSELARAIGTHHPDRDPRTVEMATATGTRSFLVQSVATDREAFGYLLVGSTSLGAVDRTTFQGGRLVLALRLLIERSVADAEERLGRDLLQDALLHRGGKLTSAGLAGRLGYEVDGPAAVIAIRTRCRTGNTAGPDASTRRVAAEVREQLRNGPRGLAGVIGAETIVIVRADAVHECARRLLERIRASVPALHVAIGISDTRPGLDDLEPAYREALVAVAMAQRSMTERSGAGLLRFADLGLHRMLFDVDHVERVEEHVERWIGPLLRYDADHRARLVETLSAHLMGDGQQSIARALSIHPSTLKYRLRRIREILGADFAQSDMRFNIELALRLNEGLVTIRNGAPPDR
ncbi:helix-turn-helix domain-containing protein [Pseudonocardia saturnea]